VQDTTRSIDDRKDALKRLQQVESELATARERQEAERVRRSIYGTDEEARDARDHDPTKAPKLPIDTKNNLPPGVGFGRKELGLPSGSPRALEMQQVADTMKSVDAMLQKIGGKETVWTRMAMRMKGARSEAEMLRDTIDDIANVSLDGLGNAMMAAGEAIGSGSRSAAAALGASMLGTISQVAQSLGRMFMAQAIASYASVTAPPPIGPNPGGAAAGAGYTAAAAAAFGVAGLASGAANAIGGRSGGGGGGGSSFGGVGQELRNARQQQRVIVLEGDYIDLKDPKSIDRFTKQLGEAFDVRATARTRRGTKRVRG
jgi:hypothetical protein